MTCFNIHAATFGSTKNCCYFDWTSNKFDDKRKSAMSASSTSPKSLKVSAVKSLKESESTSDEGADEKMDEKIDELLEE